jgi:hypothetical protein
LRDAAILTASIALLLMSKARKDKKVAVRYMAIWWFECRKYCREEDKVWKGEGEPL